MLNGGGVARGSTSRPDTHRKRRRRCAGQGAPLPSRGCGCRRFRSGPRRPAYGASTCRREIRPLRSEAAANGIEVQPLPGYSGHPKPAAVQGELAKTEIVQALTLANQHNECDVLILSRGGGSLEDLWAFKKRSWRVPFSTAKYPLLRVLDMKSNFSIADFVADLRAATPSAAAEHAVPDQQVWLQRLERIEIRCRQQITNRLKQLQQHLHWQQKRLQQQHPGQRLLQKNQTLDQLENRLRLAMQTRLQNARAILHAQSLKLIRHTPSEKIRRLQAQQDYLNKRLQIAIHQMLQSFGQRLALHSQTLNAISPLATLERGYAIVNKVNTRDIIRQSQQLQLGDLIQTRFAQGIITSQVKDILI